MMQAGLTNSLRHGVLLGFSLAALAGAALLAGCRGNTTAAATVERKVGDPPRLTARHTSKDLTGVDPSISPEWGAATWQTLVAPINSIHTPPLTRAAVLFDDANMYLAAICEKASSSEGQRDAVSVYLDPTGQGCELLQITTDAEGHAQCTWIRSGTAMQPLPDGAPDTAHPLDVRPNTPISGLTARTFEGSDDNGKPVWRLSLALPVGSIPAPLRAPLGTGTWRLNVLRSLGAPGQGQLQSNLAPIYLNSQAQSPYRMAYLDFPAQN